MQRRPEINSTKEWEHVHLCPRCGHTLPPDEIELGSIVLGIITCPKCGWSGPINVQIVEKKTAEPKILTRPLVG